MFILYHNVLFMSILFITFYFKHKPSCELSRPFAYGDAFLRSNAKVYYWASALPTVNCEM